MTASRIEKAAIYAAAYVAVLMSDHDRDIHGAVEQVEGTRERRQLAHVAASAAVNAWLSDGYEVPE
jgi:hypothetical protein